MPRRRRRIISGNCYEICFRARQGLPLVAYKVIQLIISSAIARAQRDDKVTLCHDIWNGSHPHLVVVAWDASQCVAFYQEVQKKITDAIKRLLGLSHLRIWEGRPTVARIGDLNSAIEYIGYLYGNPAQDNLEENIERFPGLSSWRQFLRCQEDLNAQTREKVPWIRLPTIPSVPSPELSEREDCNLTRLLAKRNRPRHVLTRKPNAWMRCFGIFSTDEVAAINSKIIKCVRANEEKASKERMAAGKQVRGSAALLKQPIMKNHVPKKHGRKVFIYCSTVEGRLSEIAAFNAFCEECRHCYLCWKCGDYAVHWPPGAFRPPIPPNANLLVA